MTDQILTPTLWDPSPAEAPRGQRKTRRLMGNAARRRKKMIAFGWYGGKYVHLDFILPASPAHGRPTFFATSMAVPQPF